MRRWLVRHRGGLLAFLLLPLLVLQFWLAPYDVGPAGAATQTANPNTAITCHESWSGTGSTWVASSISVTGDCDGSALVQTLSPSSGSSCEATYNCAHSSSDPVTAGVITSYYWNGTQEWALFEWVAATSSSGYFTYADGSSCGFNQLDLEIGPSGMSSTARTEDTTATASWSPNPPSVAGTVISTSGANVAACVTSSAGEGVYDDVQLVGTTDLGDVVGVWMNNGYCEYLSSPSTCSTAYPSEFVDLNNTDLLRGALVTTSNDAVAANCTLISVTGPANEPTQVSGQSYDYTVSFAGDVDDIVALDDADTSGSATTILGKSFILPALADFDPGPALDDPQTLSYSAVAGDVVNPDFWCYSSTTGWVQWGDYSAIGNLNNTTNTNGGGGSGSGSGGSFDLGTCFSYSGFSVTDPGTWVTGVLKDGECVLQWLFVPSSASVNSVEKTFGLQSSNSCSGGVGIVTWMGCVAAGAVSIPSADVADVKSAVDAGGCSDSLFGSSGSLHLLAVNRVAAPSGSIGMCDVLDAATTGAGDSSSGSNTAESLLQEVLTAAVYVFATLWLIQLLRRVLGRQS